MLQLIEEMNDVPQWELSATSGGAAAFARARVWCVCVCAGASWADGSVSNAMSTLQKMRSLKSTKPHPKFRKFKKVY